MHWGEGLPQRSSWVPQLRSVDITSATHAVMALSEPSTSLQAHRTASLGPLSLSLRRRSLGSCLTTILIESDSFNDERGQHRPQPSNGQAEYYLLRALSVTT